MQTHSQTSAFQPLNTAYNTVFRPDRLSIGLVVPIERYAAGPVPTMERHLERVELAEALGFASVWLRDIPFNVPAFGDAGQTYDPFVYLGLLAGRTRRIGLGVSSIILPLRHPVHVAKAAASVDQLSGGRLLLGVASGDRPEEFPAMGAEYHERGALFRQSIDELRRLEVPHPYHPAGGGMKLLPKPNAARLPLLITGGSQQSPEWIARRGDGWMLYPRHAVQQARIINAWRDDISRFGGSDKPAMEPCYIDVMEDPAYPPEPIHLGLRLGVDHLKTYLRTRQEIGINHVALNLRFNRADIETTLKRIAADVLPEFPTPMIPDAEKNL
ncbi:MAG: LLM class oxidoreductase [Pseudomonadota bacterium]